MVKVDRTESSNTVESITGNAGSLRLLIRNRTAKKEVAAEVQRAAVAAQLCRKMALADESAQVGSER